MCWMVPARPSGAAPLLVLSCSGAFCSAAAIPCVKPFATITALMLQLSRATRPMPSLNAAPRHGLDCEKDLTGKQGRGKERKGIKREGKERKENEGQERKEYFMAWHFRETCAQSRRQAQIVYKYQSLALHCNMTIQQSLQSSHNSGAAWLADALAP